MFPPAPNEKKSEGSLIARIFYFLFGAFFGLFPAFRLIHFEDSPLKFGLIVLAFGLVGLLAGKGIFEGGKWF